MTLPSSGNSISFGQIEGEFGGEGGSRLGKYRREFSISNRRSFSSSTWGLFGACGTELSTSLIGGSSFGIPPME